MKSRLFRVVALSVLVLSMASTAQSQVTGYIGKRFSVGVTGAWTPTDGVNLLDGPTLPVELDAAYCMNRRSEVAVFYRRMKYKTWMIDFGDLREDVDSRGQDIGVEIRTYFSRFNAPIGWGIAYGISRFSASYQTASGGTTVDIRRSQGFEWTEYNLENIELKGTSVHAGLHCSFPISEQIFAAIRTMVRLDVSNDTQIGVQSSDAREVVGSQSFEYSNNYRRANLATLGLSVRYAF
ncbi:hypothetical protein [Sanyastnella coralliicola]|uniref:hypothetical protein n=1 Tax=Sanyastnella coralliicola TaxID=3069118 RepID=UPI0027B95AF6|nr:hypothetical protein [Longitalea sp. SCSIO 12813]